MSYIKRFSRWNNSSFQVSIYPRSKAKEELGKINFIEGEFEWYVNPSITCPTAWNVTTTEYGRVNTFNDAKKIIESYMK